MIVEALPKSEDCSFYMVVVSCLNTVPSLHKSEIEGARMYRIYWLEEKQVRTVMIDGTPKCQGFRRYSVCYTCVGNWRLGIGQVNFHIIISISPSCALALVSENETANTLNLQYSPFSQDLYWHYWICVRICRLLIPVTKYSKVGLQKLKRDSCMHTFWWKTNTCI